MSDWFSVSLTCFNLSLLISGSVSIHFYFSASPELNPCLKGMWNAVTHQEWNGIK